MPSPRVVMMRSWQLNHAVLSLALLIFTIQAAPAAEEGRAINVVPFGQTMQWEKDGRDYGVMWEDARDVFLVVVTFAEAPPDPRTGRLEYWQSSWPHSRVPRDRPSGSGAAGWLNLGDWFQGRWQAADARREAAGRTWTYTFNPLNAREFPGMRDFPAQYRTTLKLRLVGEQSLPAIASLAAYTDSTWLSLEFEIEWDKARAGGGKPRAEVFNGVIEESPGRAPGGTAQRILYARTKAYNSFDETVVTVHRPPCVFSFAASDLKQHGHIFLPDFGALVRLRGLPVTYESAEEAWRQARASPQTTDLYRRVSVMPEQTLTRAWQETPAKGKHYIPLSFEGANGHFGLDELGNAWNRAGRRYQFGLPPRPAKSRTLVDGCLPIVISEWMEGGIAYQQTAFVVPLEGVPPPGTRIQADAPLVLMVRLEMKRSPRPSSLPEGEAAVETEAHLALDFSTKPALPGVLLDGDLVVTPGAGAKRGTLMRIVAHGRPGGHSLVAEGGQIRYRARLAVDDRTRTIDLTTPSSELTSLADLTRLRSLRFDEACAAVRGYWEARVMAGAQIKTPEPMINDFYKAHVSHLLINTEREKSNSDRYMARVGTFAYGVFPNESCMMIADLDRRGYHDVAARALETWLHYQGTVGMPGDFSTRDGQLYGSGGYEMGGYNNSHGWILWCLGEHYWYTRDEAWLWHAAPGMVKGCQWIIDQRRRTTEAAERSPIRAIERGLLPPGSLEDIKDWRSWLATNVATWWGMHSAARALDAAGHAEGARLVREADRYHADLMAACTLAMQRSPVVRLRDGSWIPHIPSDFHRRGRSFGWITETLEGAIHLVICGAVEPHDRLATWIIQDYEDNLYLSQQYGYQLPGEQFERRWFSHGGVSQQANLLLNPLPYLYRDEPKHFLRAYFNAFAVSYFPDTRMMTEHALPNIGDWRGDHYKTSDEANSTGYLRQMFVAEHGEELWLGAAVPRYWLADGRKVGIRNAPTYFGPMSVQLESAAAHGHIQMTVDPPLRNPPKLIRARFRHPGGLPMLRCEVNGKAHERFDPQTEWVELMQWHGPLRIVAYYAAR